MRLPLPFRLLAMFNRPPKPPFNKAIFKEWRAPRFGTANPERMNNPVWEWLVETRLNAYQANKAGKGPSSFEAGPCWCFDRHGQSTTLLPDGRTVLIAGEHEDSYDPDFYIYNDVVVKHPDGSMTIYGYPREIFPPTDFHSATLVGDAIILIGSLGYAEDRKPGQTQTYRLNLADFSIDPIPCAGECPGWLHAHSATFVQTENAIIVSNGKIETRDQDLTENNDDWKLHIAEWRWERLTQRQWPQYKLRRQDQRLNQLAMIGSAARMQGFADRRMKKMLLETIDMISGESGTPPDLNLYKELYVPPLTHETLPAREEEYFMRRIQIDGVTVRYAEELHCVRVVIEGALPQATADIIVSDLKDKLTRLENHPYEILSY